MWSCACRHIRWRTHARTHAHVRMHAHTQCLLWLEWRRSTLLKFWPFQKMQSAVKECLEEASRKRARSIAFPTLGTGKLGYPGNQVASTMFSVISKWLQDHRDSSVKEVQIIVFSKDNETLQVRYVFAVCLLLLSHSLATERDLVGYRIIPFSISASVLENKQKNEKQNKKILVIIWMRHCLYLIFCKCSLKLKL